jgi:hypothetical protein
MARLGCDGAAGAMARCAIAWILKSSACEINILSLPPSRPLSLSLSPVHSFIELAFVLGRIEGSSAALHYDAAHIALVVVVVLMCTSMTGYSTYREPFGFL